MTEKRPLVVVLCPCGHSDEYSIHFAPGEDDQTAIEKFRTAEMVNDEWAAYCRSCETYRFARVQTNLEGFVVIRINDDDALITLDDITYGYPDEYQEMLTAFAEHPHKNASYVSVFGANDVNGTTVGQAEKAFRRTAKRALRHAVPPMCTACSAPLSETDLRRDGAAPEVGWEYCECPDCEARMSPEVLSHV